MSSVNSKLQSRTQLLLGQDYIERVQSIKVLLFGVGGVGSWCAECLVRSGIKNITVVDSDCVSASNCNRQLIATTMTIGQPKVDVLRERLLEINPDANVVSLQKVYNADTASNFCMENYDFIVDAIDSLKDKADLILRATTLPGTITFISSMGAALRRNPFMVRETEFWNVKGDPLARALRKKFKHMNVFPARKFPCVYSEEKPMENTESQQFVADELSESKAQINGSLCQITATFGMAIASIIINKIVDNVKKSIMT